MGFLYVTAEYCADHHTVLQSFLSPSFGLGACGHSYPLDEVKDGCLCVCIHMNSQPFFSVGSTHALTSGSKLYCGCARIVSFIIGELWGKAIECAPPPAGPPMRRMQILILVYFWSLFMRGEASSLMGMNIATIVVLLLFFSRMANSQWKIKVSQMKKLELEPKSQNWRPGVQDPQTCCLCKSNHCLVWVM